MYHSECLRSTLRSMKERAVGVLSAFPLLVHPLTIGYASILLHLAYILQDSDEAAFHLLCHLAFCQSSLLVMRVVTRDHLQDHRVICEVYRRVIEALIPVHFFLTLKDLIDEGLVELLVCVIDAELLKRVKRHAFKPENVQNPDASLGALLLSRNAVVALFYDVFKHGLEETLADRVAVAHGHAHVAWDGNRISTLFHDNAVYHNFVGQSRWVAHSKTIGHNLEVRLRLCFHLCRVLIGEFELP